MLEGHVPSMRTTEALAAMDYTTTDLRCRITLSKSLEIISDSTYNPSYKMADTRLRLQSRPRTVIILLCTRGKDNGVDFLCFSS